MIPERILAPFEESSFRTGLAFGTAALALGVVSALAWRFRHDSPLPAAGLLAVAAAIAALDSVRSTGAGLVAAMVALGGLGLVVDIFPRAERVLGLLGVPGAWIVMTETDSVQPWAPLALGLVVALGAPAVAMFDRQWRSQPLGPALLAVSFVGVYLTVPETKEALPVLGAVLPLAVIGWPTRLASLGTGGSFAATGLLAWTVGQGGTFRDSAVVGGLACLGLLVAYPIGRALVLRGWVRTRGLARPAWALVAVSVLHVVVVGVASRGAGLRDNLASSVILAALALTLAVAGAFAIEKARIRAAAAHAMEDASRPGRHHPPVTRRSRIE